MSAKYEDVDPDEELDEFLAQLTTEEASSLLAQRPELRERLEAARLLASDLDRHGALQQAVLAEARRLERQPAEERLADLLLRRSDGARAPARKRAWSLALAAAALLAFVVAARFLRPGAGSAGGPDELLGPALELLEPVGEVSSFDAFRWTPPARPANAYVVVVHDGSADVEIERSPALAECVWYVPRASWSTWPREIRWEVRPIEVDGREGRGASARASLR